MRNGLIRCGVALHKRSFAFGHFPRVCLFSRFFRRRWFFLQLVEICFDEWTDAYFHRGIATLPMMLEQIPNEPDPIAFIHRIKHKHSSEKIHNQLSDKTKRSKCIHKKKSRRVKDWTTVWREICCEFATVTATRAKRGTSVSDEIINFYLVQTRTARTFEYDFKIWLEIWDSRKPQKHMLMARNELPQRNLIKFIISQLESMEST